jgi:hypothetical protein
VIGAGKFCACCTMCEKHCRCHDGCGDDPIDFFAYEIDSCAECDTERQKTRFFGGQE